MKFPWRTALVLLSLLATSTVQLAATSHWHPLGGSLALVGSAPQSPAGNPGDQCLLCQVAAHLSSSAPPPSPWALFAAPPATAELLDVAPRGIAVALPSHAWQGRAPPRT